MSGLKKRLLRRLVRKAAQVQRKATAGGGQYRKPLRAWIASTKHDLATAAHARATTPEVIA